MMEGRYMTQVLVAERYLQDIADAIRYKSGTTISYLPSEMAEAILAIPTVQQGYATGSFLIDDVTISANSGVYDLQQTTVVSIVGRTDMDRFTTTASRRS